MKANNVPVVSICIPTFNGEAYIEECLNSALSQTYNNIELIISDDASNDNTLEIINVLKGNTEIPIHIFHHAPNGIGANWNNCIKNSNGQYIKFLFQDDVLAPDCVEKHVNVMRSESNIAMVYAKRHFIHVENSESILEFKKVYGNLHENWSNLKINEGVIEGKAYLKDRNFLNAPKNKIGEPTSVLIDKACFDKVGYFNEELKQALDCEFWSRLMPFYKIGFVDEHLSSFRLHAAQASAVNKSEKINETEVLYKMYYDTLLPYLHKECRLKLQKRFHPIISRLVKLKARFS
ncbi:glycosyltransferase [uncultured Winogradskyella sp.]|uniref:glycosyltransferase family 2 protein n=1 Tax=uncultured Winogradskyella sp. TaxID=395353 RepID=UPI0026278120|nr:glycosyltransferase [uncultured Winogradskyella sp.]